MRNNILIVGGGMMGCGIAAIAAAAGEKVTVVESNTIARTNILKNSGTLLEELWQNGLLSTEDKASAERRILVEGDLERACADAEFVIEAIVENLEAKQQLFALLDSLLPPEVILASNTSGLRITDIGAQTVNKSRIVTAHFWFPAHLVPLVEVVMSANTTLETAEYVKERLTRWGKSPVIVKKDLPGQLANRILQAVIREASAIVEMGLASPEDVDTAVKMGMGIRFPVWGPLEHVDAVGLELCAQVQNTVLPDISSQTQANTAFSSRLDAGALGHKSGRGFYDWSEKDMQKLQSLRNEFIIEAVKFIRKKELEG